MIQPEGDAGSIKRNFKETQCLCGGEKKKLKTEFYTSLYIKRYKTKHIAFLFNLRISAFYGSV